MNEQIQSEYKKILEDLTRYAKAYYAEGKSLVSDYEYDQLYERAQDLEKEYPQLVMPDSPTQQVGSDLQTSHFRRVVHAVPMLSLKNIYEGKTDEESLGRIQGELNGKVLKTLQRDFGLQVLEWVLEPKVDGVSICVRYEKGVFIRALTRGDGKEGDDVTENVKQIKNIPHEIKGELPDVLEICGEIYIALSTLERINKRRKELGEEPFANPRNTAFGSLKQIDSEQAEPRDLEAIFYGLGEYSTNRMTEKGNSISIQLPENQSDLIQWFRKIGIPTFGGIYRCMTPETLLLSAKSLDKERKEFPYKTDGAAIKLNDFQYRLKVGNTEKSPRWAFAYKYEPQKMETKLKSITWQIGRTGQITPVAELEPVKLDGSTVSRATLHNLANVNEKDIRIGDTVVIMKAGDVIPAISEVVTSKRTGNEEVFQIPEVCPSCGGVLQSRDSSELVCTNEKCPAQCIEKIKYWCSRSAMDIYGGSGSLIAKLIESRLVKDVSDLYTLTIEQVSPLLRAPTPHKKEDVVQDSFLPGFEIDTNTESKKVFSKQAQKFLAAVQRSKGNSFKQVLAGLGINNIGLRATRLLAERYNSIDELASATEEELIEISGIGKTIAQSIHDWCNNPANIKLVARLREIGLNC